MTYENILSGLNELLVSDKCTAGRFSLLIKSIEDLCKPKYILLDFNYFNEARLAKAKKEKIKLVKIQDFDSAATIRQLEKECQNYIEIRTEFNIDKSMFYYDQNLLFYFYFGTAKNDKKVKHYFDKIKSYKVHD